jgi:uncharacterized protein YkwD
MNKSFFLAAVAFVFSTVNAVSAKPPTADASGNLTQQVIAELNRVRSNPQAYAAYLEHFRSCYQADGTFRAPGRVPLRTREGVGALDEAIRELNRATPQPLLTTSDILAGSAHALVVDQSQNGQFGHGSFPFERMARCGVTRDFKGENVAYGARTAESIVYNLVVDDGVRDRGHRRNILTTEFHEAGVSYGSHPKYGVMCVIDFAGGYGR